MAKEPTASKRPDEGVKEISAKIDAAYKKLAAKFRERAEKAKERLKTAKKEDKRVMHRRRLELYSDAAADLEARGRSRRGGKDD